MDFIAFDFETGNYYQDSAISIGLVKYSGGIARDSFYSLIKPPKLWIIPEFTDIHGLTVNDVRNAPTFAEIWEDIKDFINDLPMVAHNARFDTGILKATLGHYKIPLPKGMEIFDSLEVARKTWPEFSCYKLTYLGEKFGITYEAHNALADSETCGKVILKAAEKLGINASECSVTDFIAAAGCKLRKL